SAAGTVGDGFVCNYNAVTNQVTCTGGQIGPNGGTVITIVISTGPGGCTGILVNTATVDPSNAIPESNENNNTVVQATTCGLGSPTTTPQGPTSTASRTPTATSTTIPS